MTLSSVFSVHPSRFIKSWWWETQVTNKHLEYICKSNSLQKFTNSQCRHEIYLSLRCRDVIWTSPCKWDKLLTGSHQNLKTLRETEEEEKEERAREMRDGDGADEVPPRARRRRRDCDGAQRRRAGRRRRRRGRKLAISMTNAKAAVLEGGRKKDSPHRAE